MKQHVKRIVIAASIIAIAGFSANAFAGWGMGYGHGPRGMGHGPGSGWNCPYGGPGMAAQLDSATAGKVNEARQAFFQETAEIREKIYQKTQALEYALASDNPNPEEAAAIQRELSDLQAQFDQKRLAHRMEMRKSFPELTAGYGCRGMGRGRMMQGGWGNGPGR